MTKAFDGATAARIARAFLPPRWYRNRWHYYYAGAKLRSDPLYPGVAAALRGADAPLLDLGCGPGLLAHALRAVGLALPYRGVDNDAGKIAVARQAAERAGLRDVRFEEIDLAAEPPAHRGNVAILDVLQYLSDEAQQRTLDAAIAMLTPGARLVIRTGLEDGSRSARFTRAFDQMAHRLGWMNTGPKRYPDAASLHERFAAAGLQAWFSPLSGHTPFNNWLVVVTQPVQPAPISACPSGAT